MKFTTLCLLITISFLGEHIIFAQVGGNVLYSKKKNTYAETPNASFINDDVMLIEVNSLMNVIADNYVAIFNVNQLGANAEITNQLMNERINGVVNDLVSSGYKKESIYIDMISFVPEYEYEVQKKLFSKTYNEVPKGFELQKNIHISYKNSNMLDEFITICSKYEIYDLVKVEYYSNNTKTIYDTLRIESLKLIHKRINMLKKLNMDIITDYKIYAEKKSVKFPFERYEKYSAHNSSTLEATKKKSGVTKVKKNTSFYYNPVSYKNFDIIINPIITEPVIQYALNMKVRVFLKKPLKEKKKEYYLISPEGKIKNIDW